MPRPKKAKASKEMVEDSEDGEDVLFDDELDIHKSTLVAQRRIHKLRQEREARTKALLKTTATKLNSLRAKVSKYKEAKAAKSVSVSRDYLQKLAWLVEMRKDKEREAYEVVERVSVAVKEVEDMMLAGFEARAKDVEDMCMALSKE